MIFTTKFQENDEVFFMNDNHVEHGVVKSLRITREVNTANSQYETVTIYKIDISGGSFWQTRPEESLFATKQELLDSL